MTFNNDEQAQYEADMEALTQVEAESIQAEVDETAEQVKLEKEKDYVE